MVRKIGRVELLRKGKEKTSEKKKKKIERRTKEKKQGTEKTEV